MCTCMRMYSNSDCSFELYHSPYSGIKLQCEYLVSTLVRLTAYRRLVCIIFSPVPLSPTDVEITVINFYTVHVSWSTPDMSNHSCIDEYRVSCYTWPSNYTIQTVYSSSTSVIVADYYFSFYDYCCCVSGTGMGGPESCVSKRGLLTIVKQFF